MTIDTSTTAGKIAVMQAFERGLAVEFQAIGASSWHEAKAPMWNWEEGKYRIKPREPREFMILLSSTGYPSAVGYASDSGIIVPPHLRLDEVTTIKVREVIE